MKHLPDGLGRTAFIAGLAGSIFGAFLLVTPQLAANGTSTAGESIGAVPATAVPETTTAVPPTTTTVAPTTTSAPATAAPTTTTSVPGTPGTFVGEEPMIPELGYDGSITITASVSGPLSGDGAISDGDEVTWQFHVVNATDDELWGVFVWLELEGRATCGEHHLLPNAATDCYITATAQAGDHIAEAWVNAWTTSRQVKDKVFYTYRVIAG